MTTLQPSLLVKLFIQTFYRETLCPKELILFHLQGLLEFEVRREITVR